MARARSTLVDTHRFIPTTQGDSVDLNFIPSNLIERTEIVTGGASAAYGSGAISGVVNIFLNHKLNGIKFDADYGQTEHSDGKNYHFGIAGGTDLFGGRGHIIAGGEYQKEDAIQSCSDARDWCARGLTGFGNDTGFNFTAGVPYTPKIPGQPWSIVTDNVRYNQLSTTGVIFNNTPNATSTFQLTPDGKGVTPFAVGRQGYRGPGGSPSSSTAIGGDGAPTFKNLSIYPEVDRKTTYARMSMDFTDNLAGFVEASWGQVKGVNHQWSPGQNSANNCVLPDNAYVQGNTALVNALNARIGQCAIRELPERVLLRRHGHHERLVRAERPDGHHRYQGDTRRGGARGWLRRVQLVVGRLLPVRQDQARPDRSRVSRQLALHARERCGHRQSAGLLDVRQGGVPRDARWRVAVCHVTIGAWRWDASRSIRSEPAARRRKRSPTRSAI